MAPKSPQIYRRKYIGLQRGAQIPENHELFSQLFLWGEMSHQQMADQTEVFSQ
jgi:hypothetical protein